MTQESNQKDQKDNREDATSNLRDYPYMESLNFSIPNGKAVVAHPVLAMTCNNCCFLRKTCILTPDLQRTLGIESCFGSSRKDKRTVIYKLQTITTDQDFTSTKDPPQVG